MVLKMKSWFDFALNWRSLSCGWISWLICTIMAMKTKYLGIVERYIYILYPTWIFSGSFKQISSIGSRPYLNPTGEIWLHFDWTAAILFGLLIVSSQSNLECWIMIIPRFNKRDMTALVGQPLYFFVVVSIQSNLDCWIKIVPWSTRKRYGCTEWTTTVFFDLLIWSFLVKSRPLDQNRTLIQHADEWTTSMFFGLLMFSESNFLAYIFNLDHVE